MFDQRCVNKVSRRFWLLLFLWLVFWIQLANIFFSIACLWMSIGIITVEFLVIGVYSQGVFCWKHCLYLNCCFTIRNSISVWYFAFRFLWDMMVDIKVWFEYTYKASENFRNLQKPPRGSELWKQYIDLSSAIRFWNIAQFVITVVAVISLAMKQFMCIKFHRVKKNKPNFTRD